MMGNDESTVRGFWRAREYALASGPTYPLEGLMCFDESDWTGVLCVVEGGRAVWGEGLTGGYTVRGDRLTFSHRITLSAGDLPPGVPTVPRLILRDVTGSRAEECRIEVAAAGLRIQFPSGNAMTFARVPSR